MPIRQVTSLGTSQATPAGVASPKTSSFADALSASVPASAPQSVPGSSAPPPSLSLNQQQQLSQVPAPGTQTAAAPPLNDKQITEQIFAGLMNGVPGMSAVSLDSENEDGG